MGGFLSLTANTGRRPLSIVAPRSRIAPRNLCPECSTDGDGLTPVSHGSTESRSSPRVTLSTRVLSAASLEHDLAHLGIDVIVRAAFDHSSALVMIGNAALSVAVDRLNAGWLGPEPAATAADAARKAFAALLLSRGVEAVGIAVASTGGAEAVRGIVLVHANHAVLVTRLASSDTRTGGAVLLFDLQMKSREDSAFDGSSRTPGASPSSSSRYA